MTRSMFRDQVNQMSRSNICLTEDSASIGFLLAPEIKHLDFENKITDFVRDEVAALDRFLSGEMGAHWAELRQRHRLPVSVDDWKSAWATRIAARLLLSARERRVPLWNNPSGNWDQPLDQIVFRYAENKSCNLITRGSFLDDELRNSYHPEIEKNELFSQPLGESASGAVSARFTSALNFLERYYEVGFSVFSESVMAVVPLQTSPALEPGKCVSLSVAAAPGVVMLTMTPTILLAETLVHEAAHCRLSATEAVTALWRSGKARVQSPLRPDPRPIAGLYHQTYVLFWLTNFYRHVIQETHDPVVHKNLRQIHKRLNEIETGFKSALDTLRANRLELTPLGESLVEQLALRVSK